MSISHLKNNLNWQLLRIAITTKHSLMNIAESYGLSVMQLYTLCLLDADTSIPMNTLSHLINCDASNITGIVDRLYSQNYIKREENPNDRREKMITLTEKGEELAQKISQEVSLHESINMNILSPEEKTTLKMLLTKIISYPHTP